MIEEVSVRTFFLQCNAIIDYMEKFPDLTIKKVSIQKMIDRSISVMFENGLTMNDSYRNLLRLKNPDVLYLTQILMLGFMVFEGRNYKEAYEKTLAKLDNFIERALSRRLMQPHHFGNCKEDDYKNVTKIRAIYIEENEHFSVNPQ